MDDGGSDSLVCLVGRDLCLFLCVDARKAPKKQRQQFVSLAVRRAAPFADPEFDIAWSADGFAAVWYWSASRIRALLGNSARRRQRFVSEATYIGQRHNTATELIELQNGAEGRIWVDSHLAATRWWPQVPSDAQWHTFTRGIAGQGIESRALPIPISGQLAATPWNGSSFKPEDLSLAGIDRHLPKAVLAAGVLLLLAGGWQAGSIVRAQIDVWSAQAAATSLDAPLQRILDARSNTDTTTEEIAALLALRGTEETISLMAEFTKSMPGTDWQVVHWKQPTPDTLEVVLIAPQSNPEQVISSLEASSLLSDVTSDMDSSGELTIKARVQANSDTSST